MLYNTLTLHVEDEEKDVSNSESFVIGLRAKYGDPEKALSVLGKENFKLRGKLRDLKASVPGEGSMILTAEQKAKWEAWEALGLAPVDVKAKLDQLPTLESKVQEFKEGEVIQAAAGTLKYKANVLKDLLKTKGLQVEMREVTVKDGDTEVKEPRPFVTMADGKAEPLSEYAERDLKDYLPSLRAEEAEVGGVVYPEQSSAGKSSKIDILGQVLGDTYIVPSKRTES
jgi:hypothetical protein